MGRLGITILCAWAITALNTSALAQTETEPSTEEVPATAEATPADGEAETGEAPADDGSEESEEADATAQEADASTESAAPAGPAAAAEAPPVAETAGAQDPSNVETPAPTFYVLSMPGERMRDDPAPVMTIQAAIFAQVQSMIEGRPVELLRVRERLEAIMGCGDDSACITTQLTDLGAAGALIIRTDRGARRGVAVEIELHGSVSATANGDGAIGGNLTIPRRELETPAEALTETVGALRAHLPAPPRVSTLLFAVNVEGASVMVDGEEVGVSPLAPMEMRRGRRQVVVRRDGFDVHRRSVNVGLSEDVRVNVDLVPEAGTDMVLNDSGELVIAANTGPAPWYKQWYVWAGVGGAVVLTSVIIAVAASGDSIPPDPNGFHIPPIE